MLLLLLVSCAAEAAKPPKVEWEKSYGMLEDGDVAEAHPHKVIETEDGGWLMFGDLNFNERGSQGGEVCEPPSDDESAFQKMLAIKVDANGSKVFEKDYSATGCPGHNFGNAIIEAPQFYIGCGTSEERSALLFINKTSGKEERRWTFDLGETLFFKIRSVYSFSIIFLFSLLVDLLPRPVHGLLPQRNLVLAIGHREEATRHRPAHSPHWAPKVLEHLGLPSSAAAWSLVPADHLAVLARAGDG